MITITFTPTEARQIAILTAAMTEYVAAEAPAPAAEPPAAEPPAPAAEPPAPEAKTKRGRRAAAEAPTWTLEQVRAKLAALSQGGKGEAVRGLIAKFGANNLTAISADKYADLMVEAEAI